MAAVLGLGAASRRQAAIRLGFAFHGALGRRRPSEPNVSGGLGLPRFAFRLGLGRERHGRLHDDGDLAIVCHITGELSDQSDGRESVGRLPHPSKTC
jgi:hypothetical protein